MRILVAYSTTDGHTRRICERLRAVIEAQGHEVSLASVSELTGADLAEFGQIVIGASVRYGRHSRQFVDFIQRNAGVLNSRPGAFFSVSVSARKAKNRRPQTNSYIRAFLKQVAWRPQQLRVFAGKIDYPRYGFLDRTIIRLAMRLTGGPAGRDAVVNFTDWNRVDEFGRIIGQKE